MPLRLSYPRSFSVTIISFDICDIKVHRLPISKKSASIANNKTEKKCEKGTALKLKTFKMYHKARKSFQGTIMSETLWGAQPLFSFQVEEEELLSACGEKITLLLWEKSREAMAMSLTHSIPDSLTLHCCWKTQTCVFCIHNVWLQSIRWWCQRNLASPQGQGGLKKRESPSCQAFYSSLKTDYFDKVTDVFLIIFKRIDPCARHCNYYSSSSLPTGGM